MCLKNLEKKKRLESNPRFAEAMHKEKLPDWNSQLQIAQAYHGPPYQIFPQIAGSYRGSYFSKVGLLITEIVAAPSLPSSFVSLHLSPCMLITEIAAAPSLPSSFVSLHLSPCMLITEIAAAPSLPSSFVSLHADSKNHPSSFVSLRLSPCMLIRKIPASSFVSLHLFPCVQIPKNPLLQLSPFICLPAC